MIDSSSQTTQTTNTRDSNSRRWLILAVLGVGVAGLLVGVVLWRSRPTTYPTQETSTGTVTANPNVPGGDTAGQPASGGDASKDPSDSNGSLDPSVIPAAPSGQLVSNHRAQLSGDAAYSTETSQCITTPGAYCQIQFQMGATTKTLPKRQAGGDGVTVWNNWTLRSVGLSEGLWNITAVASNGEHVTSTKDALQLVVSK